MTTITNASGTEIDFDTAIPFMDDEIRELLHMSADEYGEHTAQEFFNDYCVMHREKFGDEFFLSESNPIW